ncbi:hypothetical protein [Marinobacter salicampi]|uniref:hypothetical protein n=1 Tax=Marinobacter salicampi TaxID=435907 RepID=UPI001408F775|nr:hypothetical protein [Marinobacter salicampi]
MPLNLCFGATRPLSLSLFWTLMLGLIIAPAHAYALSGPKVESFIASIKEVHTIVENYEGSPLEDELDEDDEDDLDYTNAYSSLVSHLDEEPPLKREVSAAARRHGFSTLSEWGRTGDQVFSAFMAIGLEGQPAMDEAGIESYLASMEAAQLPEEDMQEMRRSMASLLEANRKLRQVPKADIEAVRPHVDELMAIHMVDEDEAGEDEWSDDDWEDEELDDRQGYQ